MRISTTHLSLCLTAASHAFSNVQEYLDHSQSEGRGLPFTISDWFRPRYGPNVCLLLNHRETFRVAETLFSWTAGQWTSDFLSHHWEIRSHSRALPIPALYQHQPAWTSIISASTSTIPASTSLDQHYTSINQPGPALYQHQPAWTSTLSALTSLDQHYTSTNPPGPALYQHYTSINQPGPALYQHQPAWTSTISASTSTLPASTSLDQHYTSINQPGPALYSINQPGPARCLWLAVCYLFCLSCV